MRTLALIVLLTLAIFIPQDVLRHEIPRVVGDVVSLTAIIGLLWMFRDVIKYWLRVAFAIVSMVVGIVLSLLSIPFYMAGKAFQRGQLAAIKQAEPKENTHDF